ncbi:hypothetical protein AVEN_231823-1 [Araneus ventricosus]|uniref:Uncharacterized protein n=1 Tax=Araneus ventricosus TaxID=182803 RepID=A0A4Y2P2G9_ARAVE|nr:hypothetical protein AVEN_231823-1 [Araneus ventricosus]
MEPSPYRLTILFSVNLMQRQKSSFQLGSTIENCNVSAMKDPESMCSEENNQDWRENSGSHSINNGQSIRKKMDRPSCAESVSYVDSDDDLDPESLGYQECIICVKELFFTCMKRVPALDLIVFKYSFALGTGGMVTFKSFSDGEDFVIEKRRGF